MSFVNKIKGWGQKGGAEQSALDGDVAVADDYSPRRGSAGHAATDLPLADVEAAAAFDAMPQHGDGTPPPSSIISEVVPSEMIEEGGAAPSPCCGIASNAAAASTSASGRSVAACEAEPRRGR